MARNGEFVCKHCQRADFKSARGLNQHLKTSTVCSQVDQINASKSGPKFMAKLGAVKRHAASQIIDQLAAKKQRVHGDFTRVPAKVENALQVQEWTDSDEEPVIDYTEASADEMAIMEEESEESEEERSADGGNIHFEINTESLRHFKNYVAEAEQHFGELEKEEVDAIKLMDILRKKGGTLDSYDAVMKWHHSSVKEEVKKNVIPKSKKFLSRKTMMTRLAERYYKDPKNLVPTMDVILPSSSTKVNLVWHHARDCVVSLLTDPRLSDEDYLFFNNDPLAPPPADLDHIADVNTGTSYSEMYKRLITNPKKQILVDRSHQVVGGPGDTLVGILRVVHRPRGPTHVSGIAHLFFNISSVLFASNQLTDDGDLTVGQLGAL